MTQTVTIAQAKAQKEKLCETITTAIREFSRSTGLQVKSIDLRKVTYEELIGRFVHLAIEVDVKVELP